MGLQRDGRKAIIGSLTNGHQARSLASGIAGTNKIQSLAKEPVAPSKSWPADRSPVPERSAATARIGFANRVPVAAWQLCTINGPPHHGRQFFGRIILGQRATVVFTNLLRFGGIERQLVRGDVERGSLGFVGGRGRF